MFLGTDLLRISWFCKMFELLCCSYDDQDRNMHIYIASCIETIRGVWLVVHEAVAAITRSSAPQLFLPCPSSSTDTQIPLITLMHFTDATAAHGRSACTVHWARIRGFQRSVSGKWRGVERGTIAAVLQTDTLAHELHPWKRAWQKHNTAQPKSHRRHFTK